MLLLHPEYRWCTSFFTLLRNQTSGFLMFCKLIFAAGELSTSNSRFSEELFRTKRKKSWSYFYYSFMSTHTSTHSAGLQVCDFKGNKKALMDSDWTVSCKLDGGHRQMPGGDNKGWGLITGQLPSRPSPCPGDGGLARCPVLQPLLDLSGFASRLSSFTNLISSRSHTLPVRNEQLWYSRGANKVGVDLSNSECCPPSHTGRFCASSAAWVANLDSDWHRQLPIWM